MKKVNSLKLKDERAQLKKRAQSIIDLCKKEVRDLTEEEEKEIEDLKEQIAEKDEELKSLQKRLDEMTIEDEEEKEEASAEDEEDEEEKEENKRKYNNRNMKKKEFSLLKAIRSIVNNQPMDKVTQAVIAEGDRQARKAGINTQGQIQLPVESRADITVGSEGEDVVATELFDIVKPLRAKNVLVNAGAKMLTGLVGNVQLPRMSSQNVFWEGENVTAQDGAGTFDHITLTPKRLTAYISVSKMLLTQDSIDVENAIREDLINAINSKLEETILGDGDGKAGGASVVAPVGIQYGVTGESVTDFADLCEAEAKVEDANVLGECKYVMSNKCKAALRGMIKGTNATGMVYENGNVDGTTALNTSHMGSGKDFIYGDWSNLAIGQFGAVDLLVDPYTASKEAKINIVIVAYFDAVKVRPEAFVCGSIASADAGSVTGSVTGD